MTPITEEVSAELDEIVRKAFLTESEEQE